MITRPFSLTNHSVAIPSKIALSMKALTQNASRTATISLFCAAIGLGLSGCADKEASDDSKTASFHTVRASSYYSQGDISAALTEIKSALQKNPEHTAATALLGEIFLTAGDLQRALPQFERAAKADPNNLEHRFRLIETMIKLNNVHTAQLDLKELPETIPNATNEAEFHVLKGYAYLGAEDLVKAKAAFQEALKREENEPKALIGLAKASLKEGNEAKAEALTAQAEKAHPHELEVLLWQSQLAVIQENYPKAENYFTQILLQERDDTIMTTSRYFALNGMVRSLVAQGRTEEALKYSEMLEKSPQGQLLADFKSAASSLQEGKIDEAEETFNTILRRIPGNTRAEAAMGSIKFQKGDFDAAENHLLAAVKNSDSVDRAHKLLALTQLRLDKPHEVIRLVGEALKNSPDDAELLSLMGISYLKMNDLNEARNYLMQAIKRAPQHKATRLAMANLYEQDKQYAKAIKAYQEIIKDHPSLHSAYRSLLNTYIADSDIDTAISKFKRFTQPYQTEFAPHLLLAMAYIQKRDFDNAFVTAEKANKQFPDNKQVQGTLGAIHFAQARHLLTQKRPDPKELEAARQSLAKANRYAPNNLLVISNQIQLEKLTQQYEAALKMATDLQESHPETAAGFEASGLIYRHMGNLEQAVISYQQAWKLNPNTQLGLTLFDIKRTLNRSDEDILSHFESWLQVSQDNLQAHLAYGLALQSLGHKDQAILRYEKLIEFDPNNALALNNLAWLRFEKGDEQAVLIAKRAVQAAPESAEILDTYGWILLNMKEVAPAIEALEKAHQLAPNHIQILEHYIQALQAGSLSDKSKQMQSKLDTLKSQQT